MWRDTRTVAPVLLAACMGEDAPESLPAARGSHRDARVVEAVLSGVWWTGRKEKGK